MTVSLDLYIDEEDLTGIENDILYYLHKHSFLTLNEFQYIFKLDKKYLNYQLKKLYDKCYIEKKKIHNIVIYQNINDHDLSSREKKLAKVLETKLKKGIITFNAAYALLKKQEFCYDKEVLNIVINKTPIIKYIRKDGQIWIHLLQKIYSGKVIFCPECSNIILKGSCRVCDYKLH